MNYFDVIYENKENMGKILFIVSVMLFISLFLTPLNNIFIHTDERFTIDLIRLSFVDALKLTINDVHPPLYYFLLKIFYGIISTLGLSEDIFFISKIFSMIPYAIILLISWIKIRKEYGMFTSGLFSFALITMSGFYIQYLTVRMYSWCLLFLIIQFLIFKDVLKNNDVKSWSYFTLLAIIGAYAHYFLLITSGLFYLIMFVNYYNNRVAVSDFKSLIKYYACSITALIISLIPWMFVLIPQTIRARQQVNTVADSLDIVQVINYFSYHAVYEYGPSYDIIFARIIAIVLLIILLYIFIKGFSTKYSENKIYLASGLGLYLLTMIVGVLILTITFKPLSTRYILPVIGVFWLSAAIVIDKIDNRKLFTIVLIMIVILAGLSLIKTIEKTPYWMEEANNETDILEELNDKNNIIIYANDYYYACYHDDLDKTMGYATRKLRWSFEDDYKVQKNISKIIEDNEDKDVYMIKSIKNKNDKKIYSNVTGEKVGQRGKIYFLKLNKTS